MFSPRGRSPLPLLPSTRHPNYQPSLLPRTRSLGTHLYHHNRHHSSIPFPEQALFDYLPVFTARDFRSHSDVDRIVSAWIRHNPETNPLLASQLLEEDLRLAFDLVLDALSQADYGETTHSTSRRVLAELEYRFEEDAQLGARHDLRRSQHLFRSLAEISHSARSHPIGSVLVTFFATHAGKIARVSPARALAQWCYAIGRAHIREEDRLDCLARILRLRPELLDELAEEGSARCLAVLRLLDRVRMFAGPNELYQRPRRFASPPLWATGTRELRGASLRDEEELYDEYDDYRFAENDGRYLRRLEDDQRYHEIEAERGRSKILQLTMGSRFNQGLLAAPPLSSVGGNWPGASRPINTPLLEYSR